MGRIILQTLTLLFLCLPLWGQLITHYRVIDGDTVEIQAKLGFDVFAKAHIRLANYSAPELYEPGGEDAKNQLQKILDEANIEDITITTTGKKSFDRWVGQILIDGIDVTTKLANFPSLTLQARLDAAGKLASDRNKSVTVVVEEGEYDFVTLRVPPHVSLVATQEATRSVRLRYVGDGDQTLITVANGYGSRISGFEITTKNQAPRCIGISFEGSINAELNNVRINLQGQDTVGVRIKGRESITLSRLESRATVPVEYVWGDNICFRDCDLGCDGPAATLPSTVILLTGMPNQLIFDGSQSWQKGKYAIYGRINAQKSGQGLNINNLRYEQSTATDEPAIDIEFQDRYMESLTITGSRWTDRLNGIKIVNKRFLTTLSIVGGRLPGSKVNVVVQ